MASVDRRPNGRWRARWREYPGGPQHAKHFDRKLDAERFLVAVTHAQQTGSYTNPKAGQTPFSEYAEQWRTRRSLRPGTADRHEVELRLHILPTFGARPLASITRAQVERWATSLVMAPGTAGRVTATLAAVMQSAVDDELIARNPVSRAQRPRAERPPIVPLEPDEIRRLAHEMPEYLRAAVILSAGTGLRQGEAMAVTTDRLDFLRRELRVDRQLWSPAKGAPHFAPPKTAQSYRTIALSSLVVDALSAHLAAFAPGPDGMLFHSGGHPVSRANLGGIMRRATARAGVDATWHDLRHHHASVLLSAGVSPAIVAERLGHDVGTLLRTYAHVIRSDDDRVRAIVDAQLGGSAEDWLRTEAPETG